MSVGEHRLWTRTLGIYTGVIFPESLVSRYQGHRQREYTTERSNGYRPSTGIEYNIYDSAGNLILAVASGWKHGRLARWHRWSTCDVGEATESLDNELCRRWSDERVGEWPKPHSPTLPSLHLRHSSFFNPSGVSPTSPGEPPMVGMSLAPWSSG